MCHEKGPVLLILLLCLSECFGAFWVIDMVQEGISIYKHRIEDSYSHLYNAKGVCVGSF